MVKPKNGASSSKRNGKEDSWVLTQLRRGERELEEKQFTIKNLRLELKKFNTDFNDGSLPKLDKDGIKSLQSELKAVKYHISTMEAEIYELSAVKTTLTNSISLKRTQLEKLDPSSNPTLISPLLQSKLDPLELEFTNVMQDLKITSNKMIELGEEINIIQRDTDKIKKFMLELSKDSSIGLIKGLETSIANRRAKFIILKRQEKQLEGANQSRDLVFKNLNRTNTSKDKVQALIDIEMTGLKKELKVLHDKSNIKYQKFVDIQTSQEESFQRYKKEENDAYDLKEVHIREDLDLTQDLRSIKESKRLEHLEGFTYNSNPVINPEFAQLQHEYDSALVLKKELELKNESLKSSNNSLQAIIIRKESIRVVIPRRSPSPSTSTSTASILNKNITRMNQIKKDVDRLIEFNGFLSRDEKILIENLNQIENAKKLKESRLMKIESLKNTSREDELRIKELEEILRVRESKRREKSSLSSTSNRHISSSSAPTTLNNSNPTGTATSRVISKLIATVNEVTSKLDILRDDNTHLFLILAGVEV